MYVCMYACMYVTMYVGKQRNEECHKNLEALVYCL
jgi:hypothetical protein